MVLLRSTWRPRGSHHISHFDVAVYFKPSVPQRSSQRSLPPLLLHIKALSSEEEIVQMGKKLDALLGRSFKTTRCRALVNLAISRLAVLANQRQVRSSQAHSDVIQLLKLGHQERALFRVRSIPLHSSGLGFITCSSQTKSCCCLLTGRAGDQGAETAGCLCHNRELLRGCSRKNQAP